MMGPCPRWGAGTVKPAVDRFQWPASAPHRRITGPRTLWFCGRDRGICVNMHVRRLLPRQVARAITRQPAIGAGTGSARETGGHCRISPDPLPEDAAVPCGPLAYLEGLVR